MHAPRAVSNLHLIRVIEEVEDAFASPSENTANEKRIVSEELHLIIILARWLSHVSWVQVPPKKHRVENQFICRITLQHVRVKPADVLLVELTVRPTHLLVEEEHLANEIRIAAQLLNGSEPANLVVTSSLHDVVRISVRLDR